MMVIPNSLVFCIDAPLVWSISTLSSLSATIQMRAV
jgi:hypothetical protein